MTRKKLIITYGILIILAILISLIFYGYHILTKANIDYSTPHITSNLWKITKEGTKTSYLLGTIHIGKEKDQLPENIKKILPKINVIVTEILMPVNNDFIKRSKLKEYSNNLLNDMKNNQEPNGLVLRKNIGEKKYKKLQIILANIDEKFNDKIIEILPLSQIYIIILYPKIENFSIYNGIDSLLYNEQLIQSKKFDQLETMMDIYKLFKSLDENYVINTINYYIDNIEIVKELYKFIYYFYNDDKFQKLLEEISKPIYYDLSYQYNSFQKFITLTFKDIKYIFKNIENIKKANEALLTERNKKWLPKIEKFIKEDNTLIAVGLGHLGSKDGLINLLRNKGYTVTPVLE